MLAVARARVGRRFRPCLHAVVAHNMGNPKAVVGEDVAPLAS